MSRRTGPTVSTGAVLTGLYVLYAAVVSPWIAPPSIVEGPSSPIAGHELRTGPVLNSRMAERYLPSQTWPADASIQLRTESDADEAFIYAQHWELTESKKSVHIEPFALIWRKKAREDDEAPITIVSNYADIEFASQVNLTNPNPGRIVSGALRGEVQIEGPDGLKITGESFEFQEEAMRLWCDSTVTFRYGPHRGTALGLQIELVPDANARRDNRLGIAGIESIRLRRKVFMRLVSGPTENSHVRESAQQPDETHLVNVRSAGSFDYVVSTHIATFEENVRVDASRPGQPDGIDSLQCDRLTLVFEPNSAAPKPAAQALATPLPVTVSSHGRPQFEDRTRTTPDRNPQSSVLNPRSSTGLSGTLQFRRLRAEGRIVLLNSESNRLTARMSELIYDDETKVAKLTGWAPPGSPRDGGGGRDGQVVVVQDATELRAPEIRLMQDEEGRVTTAWCKGAGRLKHVDPDTGTVRLAAEWKKQLRKFPAETAGVDVIEFEEQVLVRQPERNMGLAAEFLRLWIERKPEGQTGAAPPDDPGRTPRASEGSMSQPGRSQPAQPSSGRAEGTDGDFRPQRMLALKDVALISSSMNAVTQRLEVWFERAPSSQTTAETIRQPDKRTTPHRGGDSADSAQPSELSTQSEPPIELKADLIRLRIVDRGTLQQAEPAEVWTFGDVRVQQKHASGEPPFHLTGDRLHIENRGGADQVLHVFGDPAQIRDRGLRMEGADLHFDRQSNVVRVESPGLLELPVERTLQGETLDQPALLDIWWHEQMTFDGKTAHFFGDVESILNDHSIRCQEMQVELTEALSFRGDESRQQAEVERVLCRGRVEFESSTYEGRKLTAVHQGQFAEFSLNQQTGKTIGQGPGWIRSWRRGRGKRAALSPMATAQANKPLQPSTTEWEYTRIDFAGKTDGNLNQQFTTFQDRVEIVYGPVNRPMATIDPHAFDRLPKDAGWMRCDSLTLTQHEKTDSAPAYLQLSAQGNVELEGRTFFARADRISYDESKGLYILRSLAPRKATIWRQTKLGGESSRISAQSMQFIPSENILKSDRATGLEGVE